MHPVSHLTRTDWFAAHHTAYEAQDNGFFTLHQSPFGWTVQIRHAVGGRHHEQTVLAADCVKTPSVPRGIGLIKRDVHAGGKGGLQL